MVKKKTARKPCSILCKKESYHIETVPYQCIHILADSEHVYPVYWIIGQTESIKKADLQKLHKYLF